MDPCETPQAGALNSVEIIEDQDLLSFGSSSGRPKSKVNMFSAGEDRSKVEGFISRRGSELALKYLCIKFGGSLFDKLPKIWNCLVEVLKPCDHEGPTPEDEKLIDKSIDSIKDPQILINNIQVSMLYKHFLLMHNSKSGFYIYSQVDKHKLFFPCVPMPKKLCGEC